MSDPRSSTNGASPSGVSINANDSRVIVGHFNLSQQMPSPAANHLTGLPLAQTMETQTSSPSQSVQDNSINSPVQESTIIVPNAAVANPPLQQVVKCCKHSCIFRSRRGTVARYVCWVDKCNKEIHFECYRKLVLGKNKLPHFFGDDVPGIQVACCKKHYDTAVKTISSDNEDQSNKNLAWNEDGKLGKNDPNSSENFLIKWLSDSQNFQKYKGDDKTGKSKIAICAELLDILELRGVRKKRDPRALMQKIANMQLTWKSADDWAHQTGVGVKQREGYLSFRQKVMERCYYYFEWEPVMKDRAGTRPPYDSDQLQGIGPPATPIPTSEEVMAAAAETLTLSSDSEDEQEFSELTKKRTSAVLTTPKASSYAAAPKKKTKTTSSSSKKSKKSIATNNNNVLMSTTALEQHMCEIESQKQELENQKWMAGKRERDVDYKMKLVRNYKELSKDWDDEFIISMIPDMKQVIDSMKQRGDGANKRNNNDESDDDD